jgi:hypothetical protein
MGSYFFRDGEKVEGSSRQLSLTVDRFESEPERGTTFVIQLPLACELEAA